MDSVPRGRLDTRRRLSQTLQSGPHTPNSMSGAGLLLAAALAVRSLSTVMVAEKVFFPRPLPCRCRMSRTPFRSLPLGEEQLCIPRFPTSLRRNLHLSPTTAEIIRPLFLIYIEVASPVGRSVVGPLGVLYEEPSPRGLISPRRFLHACA